MTKHVNAPHSAQPKGPGAPSARRRTGIRVPAPIVPLLIVLAALGGIAAARVIAIPSVELDLHRAGEPPPPRLETSVLLVDGVRCVDTARQAASTLEDLNGVERYVAFASRNRVEVTFDPQRTSVEKVIEAIEGPVFDEETLEISFGRFRVLEVDGQTRPSY